MQDANIYLELIRERGKKGLPLARDVYKHLLDPMMYLKAYGKIYRNNGAMTTGITEETVDGMSLEKIAKIIEPIKSERYKWSPARRTYIPKKDGKKRPLGMPTWSDKLLQEVIRQIMEAYYEPQFSNHSHGFRPERGCHTALMEIQHTWPGTIWFIEGDISKCFDTLDHKVLIETMREKIQDGRFIHLIEKLLKAGYMENWKLNKTLSGCPQGGIISPILSNIYLDKLDKFVENTLIPEYTKGTGRKKNREYANLIQQSYRSKDQESRKRLRQQAQQLPSLNPNDPDFRRLRYVRYADDFLLGFIGPKEEAEEIKQKIGEFLRNELKLELSKTKTLITNARTESARFLGYEINIMQENTKHDYKNRRSVNGQMRLTVPKNVIEEKCQKYMKDGKVKHRTEMLNESEFSIMSAYQSEYRGIVEYYQLAHNISTLSKLKWIMDHSLTMTLAAKLKTYASKVRKKYNTTLIVEGRSYKGMQITIEREGKKPLVAQWGGIPLIRRERAILYDNPQTQWGGHTELVKRMLAQTCEQCGSKEQVEVHHIRAMKDLNKYTGREKPEWVKKMALRNRKTLILCRTCHMDLHAGKPMTRQKVKFTNKAELESRVQ
jgi:group II intron reverse transcriptase/maturase